MRIAIAGAGMAGSYMLRLLQEEGFSKIDVFDAAKRTACGFRSCAWAFAPSSECQHLLSKFLDFDQYILRHTKSIEIEGSKVGADMLTVDKPALISDLLAGYPIVYGPLNPGAYDMVIDATGLQRAYLGNIEEGELIADLVQYRIRTKQELGAWLRSSNLGYEYCFPIGESEYHIGLGCFIDGLDSYRPEISLVGKMLCRCSSRLRLSSPFYSRPFHNGNVIGVGESIGTVAPIGGDGNLHSMQCAEILLKNLGDPESYSRRVLEAFDWMRRERLVLDKIRQGRRPSLLDLRVFSDHARRLGFGISPRLAMRAIVKPWIFVKDQ